MAHNVMQKIAFEKIYYNLVDGYENVCVCVRTDGWNKLCSFIKRRIVELSITVYIII